MLGPKGPIVAAEGCSPPQELEKAARRAAIFLVFQKEQGLSVEKTKEYIALYLCISKLCYVSSFAYVLKKVFILQTKWLVLY